MVGGRWFGCLGCSVNLFGVVVWCVWLFVCVDFVFVLFDLLFDSWLYICFGAFVISVVCEVLVGFLVVVWFNCARCALVIWIWGWLMVLFMSFDLFVFAIYFVALLCSGMITCL